MFHNIPLLLSTLALIAAAILTPPLASAKSVGVCVLELDPVVRTAGARLRYGDSSWLTLTSGHKFSTDDAKNADDSDCAAGNYIQLDCNGKGMDNESTSDTITATVFDEDGNELWTWSDTVGCDSITDHTFHFVPWLRTQQDVDELHKQKDVDTADLSAWILETKTDPRAQGMYVVLSTDGRDGFWIDEMYLGLTEHGKDPVIAHWGAENGKGFCLSTDPSDATRSWKNKVDGCHQAIKFVVGGCSSKTDLIAGTVSGDFTCAEDEAFATSTKLY